LASWTEGLAASRVGSELGAFASESVTFLGLLLRRGDSDRPLSPSSQQGNELRFSSRDGGL